MNPYLAAILGGLTVAVVGPMSLTAIVNLIDKLPSPRETVWHATTHGERAMQAACWLRARNVWCLRLPGGVLAWRSRVPGSDRDARRLFNEVTWVLDKVDPEGSDSRAAARQAARLYEGDPDD